MRFAKGHGTENDFVLLPDPEDRIELTAELTSALCDRRAGLGADGVLRVVRASGSAEVAGAATAWFMDYRNADGSAAEMCGNGARVYARYLVEEGLASEEPFDLVTRAARHRVTFPGGGPVSVDLGPATHPPAVRDLTVGVGARGWPGSGLCLPNPHAVAVVEDLDAVGSLADPPTITPDDAFPQGANVELVVDTGPRRLAMRVHERGSGETRSCGTGVAAAAVDAARRRGVATPWEWTVDVAGGRLSVVGRADGHVELIGPAVIVARGELDESWLAARR